MKYFTERLSLLSGPWPAFDKHWLLLQKQLIPPIATLKMSLGIKIL